MHSIIISCDEMCDVYNVYTVKYTLYHCKSAWSLCLFHMYSAWPSVFFRHAERHVVFFGTVPSRGFLWCFWGPFGPFWLVAQHEVTKIPPTQNSHAFCRGPPYSLNSTLLSISLLPYHLQKSSINLPTVPPGDRTFECSRAGQSGQGLLGRRRFNRGTLDTLLGTCLAAGG